MYRLYSDFFYNDRAIRLKFEEEFKDLIINKAQSIKVKARKNAKLISLEKMINQRLKNIRNKCSDISDLPLTLEELILLSTEKISWILPQSLLAPSDIKTSSFSMPSPL